MGSFKNQAKRINCLDGESLSVQASSGHYCSPRDDVGPYTEVEVGYPTCSPPKSMMEFAENAENPTATIYAWVPVPVVREFIEDHGGFTKDGSADVFYNLISGNGEFTHY